jgi:hypothetical protein
VAADGGVYAIDQDNAVVVKWSRDRRLERVFGGYDSGFGGLVDPVAIALGTDGRVFVADNGSATIKIFDQFGNFERAIGSGRLEDMRSLRRAGGRLMVVLPDRLVVYEASGGLVETLHVEIDEPLTDVAIWRGKLLLLTNRWLSCASLQ